MTTRGKVQVVVAILFDLLALSYLLDGQFGWALFLAVVAYLLSRDARRYEVAAR